MGLLLGVLHYNAEVKTILNNALVATRIHEFFSHFTWPKQLGGTNGIGKSVFEKRTSIDGQLHCQASEALGCFGLLLVFLELEFGACKSEDVQSAIACYTALCLVITLLSSTARGIDPKQLLDAIVLHANLFLAFYGDESWVPKFHYLFHMAKYLELHGLLIGCLALERKHKEPKRDATVLANFNKSNSPERSILEAMLHSHLRSIKDPATIPSKIAYLETSALAGPHLTSTVRQLCNSAGYVMLGTVVRCEHFAFQASDVVTAKYKPTNIIGQVLWNVSCDNRCYSAIQVWVCTPKKHCYAVTDDVVFLASENVTDALIYKLHNKVAVVVPSQRV